MLIPDISGFTHFVNHTEIIHGVHIISEMLETLIESNSMGMKVAELEGDAVFFYRIGPKPTSEELLKQIEDMYFSFHKMIKIHERDRICSCGACSTVNKLNIKFVSHYGDVVERTIHGHFQLMGSDVTKIHKLLKNNIDNDEYLLITENSTLESNINQGPNWEQFQSKLINYTDVGDVKFQFSFLASLKKALPTIDPAKEFQSSDKPIKFSLEINKSMEITYNMLTDLNIKKDWTIGLSNVDYNKNQIHRKGSSHECVLPLSTIQVETIDSSKSKDEMILTEFSDKNGFFPAIYSRFTVKKVDDDNCILNAETHFKGSYLKEWLIRVSFGNIIKKSLNNFKKLVESSTA